MTALHHVLAFVIGAAFAGLAATATAKAQPDLFDETVLRTLSLRFAQSDWQAQLTRNYASKTYIKADLTVAGVTYKDVGVRYRGNSSYKAVRSLKKPFKISMNEFVSGQELLGYNTINLNNGYRDPSFIRETLTLRMFRRWMPASKSNFVKLVVNGSNYGVYINVEQINSDLLRQWFEDPSGLRYRGERGVGGGPDDPALKWLGPNPATYTRGYQLKTENPKNPWTNLVETCRVLAQTPAARLHADLPRILDVDESLRYLAGVNLVPAMDSYIGNTAHNFYIYEDPLHRRSSLLPWDHNATFGGNSWLTVSQKQQLSPFYFSGKTGRPLLSRVMVEPEWRQRYIAHMRAMISDCYHWAFAGPLAARYQNLIAAEVQRDPLRLYPFSQFRASVTTDLQVFIGSRNQWIPGIRPMIEKRAAYLLNRADFRTAAPALSRLARTPVSPKDQDRVAVTVRVGQPAGLAFVKLYWRHLGAYVEAAMLDDGQHGDGAAGDGVYGAFIPRQNLGTKIEYYVGARSALAQGGAMAFAPPTAGHRPPHYLVRELSTPHPLRINELLADNETTDKDPAGEFDDWLELHNRGTTAAAVGGFHLSDDPRNPKLWALPAGATIPAGGHLRIWLDGQPAQGALHATFKLDRGGETVTLSDPTGRVLDIVAFGEQKADRSYGRLPDGARDLFYLWRPTGGGPVLGTPGKPQRFDLRRGGSRRDFDLVSNSDPREGNLLALQVFGGPANRSVLLGLSAGVRTLDLGAIGPLLLDPAAWLVVGIPLDGFGFGGLTATIPNGVAGAWLFAQAAGDELSNGLAVQFRR